MLQSELVMPPAPANPRSEMKGSVKVKFNVNNKDSSRPIKKNLIGTNIGTPSSNIAAEIISDPCKSSPASGSNEDNPKDNSLKYRQSQFPSKVQLKVLNNALSKNPRLSLSKRKKESWISRHSEANTLGSQGNEQADLSDMGRNQQIKVVSEGDVECIVIDDDDDQDEGHRVEGIKSNTEENSKEEVVRLLMEQIKESEKIIHGMTSPQVEKLKKELEAKTVVIKKLTEDNKNLIQKSQRIQQSREDSTVIVALKQKITDLETKIPNMIQEFTQYVEQQDSLHAIKEKEFSSVLKEKEREVLQSQERNQHYDSLSKNLFDKYEEIEKLKGREAELVKIRNELLDSLEAKNNELEEERKKFKSIMHQKDIDCKGKVLEMGENLKKQTESYNECKEMLLYKNKQLDKAEKDAQESKNKLHHLSREMASSKANVTKTSNRLKEQIERLKTDYETSMSRLENDIKDAFAQISKLKKDVVNKEVELTEKNARIKVLEKDISVKVDEITTLQVTNQKHIKACHDLNQQCQVLEKKFQNSITESQNLRYELSRKELNVNETKIMLEEAGIKHSSELRLLQNSIAERDQSIVELNQVVVEKDKITKEIQQSESELKKKLSDLEVEYLDIVAQKEKIRQEKDVELQMKAKLHDQKVQELFIEFSEKLHLKDLLLRDKALDYEKKFSASTAEFSNILQTKEKALLSLNSQLSEKDIRISSIEK